MTTRTRFEKLLDDHDLVVALWLVSHWCNSHRADDADLHRAVDAMLQRGDLPEFRWANITQEAKRFERAIIHGDGLAQSIDVDSIDLAITAGMPLDRRQQKALQDRLSHARRRTIAPGAAPDVELAYLEGLSARTAANVRDARDAHGAG